MRGTFVSGFIRCKSVSRLFCFFVILLNQTGSLFFSQFIENESQPRLASVFPVAMLREELLERCGYDEKFIFRDEVKQYPADGRLRTGSSSRIHEKALFPVLYFGDKPDVVYCRIPCLPVVRREGNLHLSREQIGIRFGNQFRSQRHGIRSGIEDFRSRPSAFFRNHNVTDGVSAAALGTQSDLLQVKKDRLQVVEL